MQKVNTNIKCSLFGVKLCAGILVIMSVGLIVAAFTYQSEKSAFLLHVHIDKTIRAVTRSLTAKYVGALCDVRRHGIFVEAFESSASQRRFRNENGTINISGEWSFTFLLPELPEKNAQSAFNALEKNLSEIDIGANGTHFTVVDMKWTFNTEGPRSGEFELSFTWDFPESVSEKVWRQR